MIFAIGTILVILGNIGKFFVDRYYTDWRDYAVAASICIGAGMCVASLLQFAARYLI